MSFKISSDLEKNIDYSIENYPESKRSAILPVLHIIQHNFGYISNDAIEWVASKLNLQPIQVLEVVSFYPGFRQNSPGKYHIRICKTLSCAMSGSHKLMEDICSKANIDRSKISHSNPISISEDKNYSIEFVECLASCGTAPVCLVNDNFHESVKDADSILKEYT